MAPAVRLVLLLALLLSRVETPSCVPVSWRRRGWTPNSAGYLLGPVLPVPQRADQGGKEKTALEILDLWKAIDKLPYSHSQWVSKRTRRETLTKPEIGDLGLLSKNIPREGEVPPS